jgi:DNA repair protein RecO (recombination protein O)
MSLKKDDAVCIRAIDYSDTSQIVTLFGREFGKIDAMAKGSKRARSRLEGPIEIFSYGHIIYTDSADQKLSNLTEFNQQPRFAALRRKLHSLNAALFGAELIESFTIEHDPNLRLFDEFVSFLDNLQESPGELTSLANLIGFQLRLLELVGSGLVLDRCVNCKSPYNQKWPSVFFSSSAHGLICRDCEATFVDKRQLGRPALNVLLASCSPKEGNNPELSKPVLLEVEKLLIYHFSEITHKLPKMAKYYL